MSESIDAVVGRLEAQATEAQAGLVALRDRVAEVLAGALDPGERAAGDQAVACYDEALSLCDEQLAELRWIREGGRRIERIGARLLEIGDQLGRLEEVFGGG